MSYVEPVSAPSLGLTRCLLPKGDLDILTALLSESEGAEAEANADARGDDLDALFDDDNEEEEYREGAEEDGQRADARGGASELFGDVDDLEVEEDAGGTDGGPALNRSREDLQGSAVSCPPRPPDLEF